MSETTEVSTTCPNQHTNEDCHTTQQTYTIPTSKILELDSNPDAIREWLFAPTEGLCAWCGVPLGVEVGGVAFSGP